MPRKKKNQDVEFVQMPIFSDDEVFEVTAQELTEMFKVSEAYSNWLPTFESMISRFIDNGSIHIKYLSKDGTEITQEEVSKRIDAALKQINKSKPPNIEPTI